MSKNTVTEIHYKGYLHFQTRFGPVCQYFSRNVQTVWTAHGFQM